MVKFACLIQYNIIICSYTLNSEFIIYKTQEKMANFEVQGIRDWAKFECNGFDEHNKSTKGAQVIQVWRQ